MNISRAKTIKKLQELAEASPFTVIKCGEEKNLYISDDEEEESFPCLKSGCEKSFGYEEGASQGEAQLEAGRVHLKLRNQ